MNRTFLISLVVLLAVSACSQEPTDSLVGTLERDRIELKVETNEPVVSVHVRDGQKVSKGDLVLEQNPLRAETRRAQQAAMRDQAAARLAELERGPRQEAIRESRARLESAQAQSVNAAAELRRAEEIFNKGLSNQAVLDRAESAHKSTLALQNAARESLAALLHGTTPEELQQAVAALAASQAILDQMGIDLERTRLLAPADGIIDKVLFQVGERTPPGTTVAVLLDTSRVFARVYVPEYLRARVRPGNTLRLRIDGTTEELTGTVRWVSSEASFTPYFALTEHDRSRLSYLAEIDVPDAGQLPSGLPLAALVPPE